MKTFLFMIVLTVSAQLEAQTNRNMALPDVREIGGTNYHVHVRIKGQCLPHWQNLRAKVVRTTKDGVLLEMATEIKHTGGYEGSRDRLRKVGGFTGGSAPLLYTWTEFRFDGNGDLILLVRHPKAKELLAGKTITVLAMRAGTHQLKEGISIARFDYGRPVDLKAPK